MIQPALLAGGSARRYGSDKRLAVVPAQSARHSGVHRPEVAAGEPLIARAYGVAAAVGAPVVLVADAADEARVRDVLPPGARFLHDEEPGQGPLPALCGLLAILLPGDSALLIAADLPSLSAELVRGLTARAEREPGTIVVPRADDRLQVGCAVYPAAALPSARLATSTGQRSLTGWVVECAAASGRGAPPVAVVEEAEWRSWGGGESPFFNLNTPADRDRLDGLGADGS